MPSSSDLVATKTASTKTKSNSIIAMWFKSSSFHLKRAKCHSCEDITLMLECNFTGEVTKSIGITCVKNEVTHSFEDKVNGINTLIPLRCFVFKILIRILQYKWINQLSAIFITFQKIDVFFQRRAFMMFVVSIVIWVLIINIITLQSSSGYPTAFCVGTGIMAMVSHIP